MLDGTWLLFVAKNFYNEQLGYLLTDSVNGLAAGIFYLLFVFGLCEFVITTAIEKKSVQYALTKGALFGLVTYATYDLTNQATIRDWPAIVTVVDLIWGTFLAASVSGITVVIIKKYTNR